MSMQPLNGMSSNPAGQFDGYDQIATSIKGGEVGSFTYKALGSATDKSAFDANGSDGYITPLAPKRPVVTTLLISGMRPLFLCDDGTSGYGTLFGSVVGGTAGQQSVGGAVIGPHTAYASGKITIWTQPGFYSVSLDAVDTNSATGLVPTNTNIVGGDALYATATGLLTPTSGSSFQVSILGRFVEFNTSNSLVTTPSYLVNVLNSPIGGQPSQSLFTQAIIHWNPYQA